MEALLLAASSVAKAVKVNVTAFFGASKLVIVEFFSKEHMAKMGKDIAKFFSKGNMQKIGKGVKAFFKNIFTKH